MRSFIRANRKEKLALPPTIEDWLPDRHLARFIVEIVEQLDLQDIYAQYGTRGAPPYDPALLLGLLFYGYCTGVFSSRKIEQATYDSIAFRYISGNHHPDHDTLADFRTRFQTQIRALFVQVLLLAHELGLVQLGHVNVDGSKIQANASKHSAMSYAYIEKLEAQFVDEVQRLLELAHHTDVEEAGIDVPAELERRETRLAKLRQAKAVLEARAQARDEVQKAAYEAKLQARQEKEQQTGKKPKGPSPQPPETGVQPKDQYNFTDPDSRIMKTPDGMDQCYNAQAAVNEQLLIVGAQLSNHPLDIKQLLPTLEAIPEALGTPDSCGADNGYFSLANILGADQKGIDPFIAPGRQSHNQWLEACLAELFEQDIPADSNTADTAKEAMRRKLDTPRGKALYRLRKMTVEPVFGIIKEVLGFRRFHLRGLLAAAAEWLLLCTAYNLKRLFQLISECPDIFRRRRLRLHNEIN